MTSPDLSPAMDLGDVAAPIGMRESAMATASVLIDGVQLGAVRCRNRSWTDGVKQQPVTADWCGVVLRVRFSHNYLRRYRILSLGVAFRRSIKNELCDKAFMRISADTAGIMPGVSRCCIPTHSIAIARDRGLVPLSSSLSVDLTR